MSGRVRSISCHQRAHLSADWAFCETSVDSIATPDAMGAGMQWQKTSVPTTAAASLRSLNAWSLDDPPRRFDGSDWWYRCRFATPTSQKNSTTVLGLDGLATVAEVWLNGVLIISSENMFVAHEINIENYLQDNNELIIRFRALDKLLTARRPRPRWRAPMIENQQIRWFRTTLLGRTPGWSPPAAVVGPWRPVWLEQRHHFSVANVTLNATVAGDIGSVAIAAQFAPIGNTELASAKIVIERNGQEHFTHVDLKSSGDCIAHVSIPKPDLWWPHTHGEPALYKVKAFITLNEGSLQSVIEVSLGSIGFRTVALNTADGDFKLSVNGIPIFCRGACWTPIDPVTLTAQRSQYAHAIQQVRDAGMNMLRISGTMVYESDEFLDLCDQNGILLWQDFMFANMDYPEDETFVASVTTEIQQQLARLSSRPCVAVLCGNSEVEQQAAMWGATRELWTPRLFHHTIADLAKTLAPGVPYWPSSAHGGAIPHQPNVGTTSYYGVGAYLRPTDDARRSDLKFATECLAFANIPDDSAIENMPRGLALRVHHPEWKARTPRDLGAGWDFEDVRDFYLRTLFGLDPVSVRYADHDRYLELGRAASGEAMAAAFREWRRKRSVCNGALIWFLRDLWPGAGWGVMDAQNSPKSVYYFLRRLLQPKAVFLSDEGNNGVFVHVVNETAETFRGRLEIALFRSDEISVGHKLQTISIPARETLELPVASLFEGFMDLSYAYRFGPPTCSAVVAMLKGENGDTVARDFYFPTGNAIAQEPDIGLCAVAQTLSNGDTELAVQSKRLGRFVTVQTEGFACDDQYFHLAPGIEHRIHLRRLGSASGIKGQVKALNSVVGCKIMTTQ